MPTVGIAARGGDATRGAAPLCWQVSSVVVSPGRQGSSWNARRRKASSARQASNVATINACQCVSGTRTAHAKRHVCAACANLTRSRVPTAKRAGMGGRVTGSFASRSTVNVTQTSRKCVQRAPHASPRPAASPAFARRDGRQTTRTGVSTSMSAVAVYTNALPLLAARTAGAVTIVLARWALSSRRVG